MIEDTYTYKKSSVMGKFTREFLYKIVPMVPLVDEAIHTNANNLGLCKKYDNFHLKSVTAVKVMCVLQSGVNVKIS